MLRSALPLQIAIAAALTLATAACDINGIGDGTRPVRMEILRASSLLDPESNRSYLCFTDQVRVIAYFSDNRQVGDFTDRQTLRLTSSNPAVIEVSNGDLAVEGSDNMLYAAGTLIPRSVGIATITAQFSELQATYEVEVVAPQSVTLSAPRLALAPNTMSSLTATADIDGEEINVTSAATWSFVEEDSEDIALIGTNTGVVAGLAPGELTARAVFALCPTVVATLEAEVEISPVTSILLTREFADAPDNELVKGTTDQFKAVATLASGDTQDLTTQITYTSDKTEFVAPNAGNVAGLMRGNDVGDALITATYTGVDPDLEDDDDPPTVDSNVVTIAVVDDTVDELSISPAGATLRTNSSVQFVAEATYTAVPTRKQLITRHVNWVSSDTSKIAVGVGFSSAGLAVSGTAKTEEDEPVTLTAKFTIGSGDDAVTIEDEVELCVIGPEDDVPEGCPPLLPAEDDDEDDDDPPTP